MNDSSIRRIREAPRRQRLVWGLVRGDVQFDTLDRSEQRMVGEVMQDLAHRLQQAPHAPRTKTILVGLVVAVSGRPVEPEPVPVMADVFTVEHEGIPGYAAKCWADVWSEAESDYVSCNEDPAGDLGLCEWHARQMTARSGHSV